MSMDLSQVVAMTLAAVQHMRRSTIQVYDGSSHPLQPIRLRSA